MSAPIISTDLDKSVIDLDLNLKIHAGSVLELHQKEFPMIIERENTDIRTDKRMQYEGPGAAPAKTEGTPADIATLRESHIDQGTQQTFAHDLPISWEVGKFAVKNARIINQLGEYQARSGILRFEFTSVDPINNGTDVGKPVGDGAAYFSASHFWKSAPTVFYTNLLPPAAMTKTSIQDDLIIIADAEIENGIPGFLKAKQINIGTSNLFILPEILKSSLDPETANNTYNAIQDANLTKNLNHYLTAKKAFTIDTQQPSRTLLEAHPIEISSYNDFKNRNLVEQLITSLATMRYNYIGSFHNASV
jgi:hypothetical protein